jgi:hypothetical protein
MTKKIFLSFIIAVTFSANSTALTKNSELYKTILSKDSLLFNVGFNRCDIKQFEILLRQPKILSRQRRNFRKEKYSFDLKTDFVKPETRQVKRFLVKKV